MKTFERGSLVIEATNKSKKILKNKRETNKTQATPGKSYCKKNYK